MPIVRPVRRAGSGRGTAARPARPGRPARAYRLTDAGRAQFGHGYDELAVAALRYLAEHGGPDAVLGFAQLLEIEDLSESDHDSVRQIIKGGRHLLDLINEVLDITRI